MTTYQTKSLSEEIAKGIYDGFIRIAVFLAVTALVGFFCQGFTPTDDTDKSKWNRSGFSLFTDAKTGLQYLSKNGNLVPRLDLTGKQMREGQ